MYNQGVKRHAKYECRKGVRWVIAVIVASAVVSAGVSALVTKAHFCAMDNYMEQLTGRIEELISLAGAIIGRNADTPES